MKKRLSFICCLLVIAFLVSGLSGYSFVAENISHVEAASKKSKNKKAMAAYKKVLEKSKYKNSSYNKFKFATYDINGDGVKELLIDSGGEYSAAQYCEIYTYYKGKARKLKAEYLIYRPIVFTNGVFSCGFAHTGGYYENYYKIKKGKLQLVSRHYYHDGPGPSGGLAFYTDECVVDGLSSTADAFTAWRNAYDSTHTKAKISYHNNSKSCRNKFLK